MRVSKQAFLSPFSTSKGHRFLSPIHKWHHVFAETQQNPAEQPGDCHGAPQSARDPRADRNAPASPSPFRSPVLSPAHKWQRETKRLRCQAYKVLAERLARLCQPPGRRRKRLQRVHVMGFPSWTRPWRGAVVGAQGPASAHGAQVAAALEVWGVLVLSYGTDYTNSWTS